MIARLRGTLAGVGEDHVIVDVGGVGYLVTVAPATLGRLPSVGEAVELHTELHMREDGISLYGFLEASDRVWFRLLQTVQGVGARVALSLLGTLRPHELANAIAAGDKAALGRASGVGSRLAARIVSELKDRVGSLPQAQAPAGVAPVAVASLGGPANDALSALLNLGYARVEAYAAIARVQARLGTDLPVDVMVREGLKELVA
ncbi:Holliday junction branch migration protein RuvA [Benzoatithermus flavus]|uniref:Holliday junction branch migration complex subunit RuvA n=1 Tax=Benzoatithermus flavus TaxID=3108223 RepID=A0ABU8XSV8_9PROT